MRPRLFPDFNSKGPIQSCHAPSLSLTTSQFQFQRSNSELLEEFQNNTTCNISIPKVQFRAAPTRNPSRSFPYFNSKGPIQSFITSLGDIDQATFQFQRSNSEKGRHRWGGRCRLISIPKVQFRVVVQFVGARPDAISIPKVQFREKQSGCKRITLKNFNSKGPIQSSEYMLADLRDS